MNELALFAGAGGGVLGGKLLGWRTVCAVECDAYAASVLVARQNDGCLPPFPVWDDVCTFDGRAWRGIVDVVSGGFPCQDISVAGKGEGITGARSGLWGEMRRIVGEVRPRYVFVENSPALTSRGLGTVLGDLAALGYDAEWGVLGADDAGAPHRRKRIWGMMRNGECWERMMPALHTGGRGSGFWPTIRSTDGDRGGRGDLIQAVRGNENSHFRMVPTPSANDWKGSSKAGQRRGQITDPAMGVIQAGGQLNPTWVELLMGWPKNWTCLDNISHVEYLQWLMENCDDEETRGREVLRVLRCGHVAEEVSRSIGRPIGIQQAAVLLADVCQHANRPDQARILMACAETLESDVRGMRTPAQAAGTSHQPGHQGQPTREHPDALQALSRLLAHYGKAAWQDGSWENAVPRVANKVANRVDRLRCLGNGQVPAVVRLAWETLFSRIG